MRSAGTQDGSLPCEWTERHSVIASGSRIALLLGVSATLLFFNLGTRVLATNDEARFPVLARDILREGHWLLPRPRCRLGSLRWPRGPPEP